MALDTNGGLENVMIDTVIASTLDVKLRITDCLLVKQATTCMTASVLAIRMPKVDSSP